MKKQTDEKNTRRNFLFGLGAAGVAAISSPISLISESKSGKKIKVLNQNNELVEVDADALSKPREDGDQSYNGDPGRVGLEGKKFVMVVDIEKCKNARKCMKSCQAAHQLRPEQHHINVLEMEDNNGASFYMPKPCQHCDNPPCVSVCPVDATFKRQDGIVLIDNQRCIGCRFCLAACPYSARSFNWTDPRDAEKYKDVEYDIETNVPQRKGTVTKCAFSADRLREGKLPYCVSACPNGVYYFGDENEDLVTNGTTRQTARLSHLLKDRSAYTLLPELGTNPNVYYLPKVKK
jgi:Fe-S-cluster-containing dehydrogenase component